MQPSGGRADPVRYPHPPDAEHGPLAASGTCPPWRSPPPTASRCRPMCWSMTGAILEDAMRRELERGGQVYYLHNRVETIDRTASRIQKPCWAGGAAVGVAHGKMTEQEAIDDVMQPHDRRGAERAGVHHHHRDGHRHAQRQHPHHRGRRPPGPGPAPPDPGPGGRGPAAGPTPTSPTAGARCCTEVAAKRLSAIREFAEFGSGFKIAMRDLEIRGAGNVLGPEQSGYPVERWATTCT